MVKNVLTFMMLLATYARCYCNCLSDEESHSWSNYLQFCKVLKGSPVLIFELEPSIKVLTQKLKIKNHDLDHPLVPWYVCIILVMAVLVPRGVEK